MLVEKRIFRLQASALKGRLGLLRQLSALSASAYYCSPCAHRPGSSYKLQRRVVRCEAKQNKDPQRVQVEYGQSWYEQTRAASTTKRTVREEIAIGTKTGQSSLGNLLYYFDLTYIIRSRKYRRRANEIANNGKERKDLYTDNWDGSEYKGSSFNILTLLGLLFVLVPVGGLAFAYFTYGVLWG